METPRTDAELESMYEDRQHGHDDVPERVWVENFPALLEFARALERELTLANEEIAQRESQNMRQRDEMIACLARAESAEALLAKFQGAELPDDVARYDPDEFAADVMLCTDEGGYVDATDYDKLALHAARLAVDAGRYVKLRRWMSSNVKEGWQEVENLGAVSSWVSHDAFDSALDALPECNVGLCQTRPTNECIASIEVKP